MKWHLLFYPIILVVTLLVSNNPFYWDTVQLASKHGHFFYETDFQSLILPEEIDSGHPPLFGMYIALAWKLFGKTLCVSHLAMLPFLFGIVFFLHKIDVKLLGERLAPWLVLLCFVDPVMAGQSVLVSPDLALVCFFLMGVLAVWEGKNGWLVIAVIGLGLISTRGMMVGLALFFFSLFVASQKITLRLFFKKLWPFIPGGLAAASYLFYHWTQTGWIGYHPGSTWAPSFERVDFLGFVKNIAVLIWRMLDFGRVFVWFFIAVICFLRLKIAGMKALNFDRQKTGWQLLALSILVFLAIGPTQLFYKGLLAHRYFLPFFVSLNIVVLYLLRNKILKTPFAVAALCLVLASGNLWVYPKKTAMGWDSTLAHLPWYGLIEKMETQLKAAQIPFHHIGTGFPNIGSREIYELNGETEGFVEKDFDENCYILYSNVMNEFTDEEIDELEENWTPIFKYEKSGVCLILYKNPTKSECEN
ncbi:MAG: hypothetical protein GC192_21745 [Bacteroidetes bacterium]|nr:hypothetical protein [Bacteroidota bacterium]